MGGLNRQAVLRRQVQHIHDLTDLPATGIQGTKPKQLSVEVLLRLARGLVCGNVDKQAFATKRLNGGPIRLPLESDQQPPTMPTDAFQN